MYRRTETTHLWQAYYYCGKDKHMGEDNKDTLTTTTDVNATQTVQTQGNTPAAEHADIADVLKNYSLDDILAYAPLAQRVRSDADRRVTQAVQTARTRWTEEAAHQQTEAEKLAKMTEAERQRYSFDQEKAAFQKEKEKFQHDQLVLETARQMTAAGLPDLADFVTGATAEETNANLTSLTEKLTAWRGQQVQAAMRGTVTPSDTAATHKPSLTADQIRSMTPAEINAAWEAGQIDTSKLKK